MARRRRKRKSSPGPKSMAVGTCPRGFKKAKIGIRVGKTRRSKERRHVSGCVAPKRNWGINRGRSKTYNVTNLATGYTIGGSKNKKEAACAALALDDTVTGKTAPQVRAQITRRLRRTAIVENKIPLTALEGVAPECYRWGADGVALGGKTFGKTKKRRGRKK